MQCLSLEVRDFESATRYRWALVGPSGELMAEHRVQLDARSPEYEAFTNLHGHLDWRAVPEPRIRHLDEARITGEIGKWIGTQVLGPVGTAIAAAAPTTVRVIVPRAAADLLYCPLELAYAAGRPLALQGVSLVMQLDDPPGVLRADQPRPAASHLRVLGLFSLPVGERALNLRHERQEFLGDFATVTAGGRAVESRTLQYGVTRQRLLEVLEEDDGWDIIHISGHGAPGELLLEREDGSADPISPQDLADLLDQARRPPRLVTLLACWSAAPATLGALLGLTADIQSTSPDKAQRPTADPALTMPSEIVARLGCAVLAMRYPVNDEFAIALTRRLYQLLAAGEPLPSALSTSLSGIAEAAAEGGRHFRICRPPRPRCSERPRPR